MTHWTASVVAILLAGFPSVARAQELPEQTSETQTISVTIKN